MQVRRNSEMFEYLGAWSARRRGEGPIAEGGTEMLEVYEFMKARVGLSSSDEGATAVEYGIMVALIAIVIIVAVALLGTNLQQTFQRVATEIGGTG